MSEQGNVSERLGLDYLIKGRSAVPSVTEQTPALFPAEHGHRYVAALQAFAADRLLNALHEVASAVPEGSGVRLSEVADRTEMDAEILVPLSRTLIADNLLSRVRRDSFGNDEVLLTDDAERLISSPDRISELIKRFETPG